MEISYGAKRVKEGKNVMNVLPLIALEKKVLRVRSVMVVKPHEKELKDTL